MVIADLHTHTLYSHGKCTVAEVAEIALEKGLQTLAISEHGKGNVFYGVSDRDFFRLRKDIDNANVRYGDKLRIYMGIEADFMGDGKADIPDTVEFDLVLIGYHRGILPKNKFAMSALSESFTNHSAVEKNTDEVLRVLDRYPQIFAVTHPNEYIRLNLDRLSRAAAERGILLEINNRHTTLNAEELRLCAANGANFLISSDGHTRNEMCQFENAEQVAAAAEVQMHVYNRKENAEQVRNLQRLGSFA